MKNDVHSSYVYPSELRQPDSEGNITLAVVNAFDYDDAIKAIELLQTHIF